MNILLTVDIVTSLSISETFLGQSSVSKTQNSGEFIRMEK